MKMSKTRRMSPTVKQLAALALFRSCTPNELARIDNLKTAVHVGTGTVICAEHQPGREFFVVANGRVCVTAGSQCIGHLASGDAFGEVALMDFGSRIATVTAVQPTELLVFNRAEFTAMLHRAPSVGRELLRIAAHRLRDAHRMPDQPNATHSSLPDEVLTAGASNREYDHV